MKFGLDGFKGFVVGRPIGLNLQHFLVKYCAHLLSFG